MKVVFCGQLIDGTGSAPMRGARVLIGDDGRITAVDQRTDQPDGAELVDLSAYTVVPGLIDAHDHLTVDTDDEHAQALESDQFHIVKGLRNARTMVRKGITTVRDMGTKDYTDVILREALDAGDFPGPRVISCGYAICRTGGHGWYWGGEVTGEVEARRAVREQLKHGAQFIKAMMSGGIGTQGSEPLAQELTDDEIRAVIDEAHRAGRKVAGHLHGGPGVRVAVEAGLDSLEHGIYLTRDDLALMAERGTVLVVTYGFTVLALTNPGVPDYFRERSRIAQQHYLERIRWAKELGVKVAAGGDGAHGLPVLELQALVQGGFTPLEALRAMTANAAELLGLSAETGTVEPGKQADLLALDGDPLADIAAVEQVRFVMRSGVEQFPHFAG